MSCALSQMSLRHALVGTRAGAKIKNEVLKRIGAAAGMAEASRWAAAGRRGALLLSTAAIVHAAAAAVGVLRVAAIAAATAITLIAGIVALIGVGLVAVALMIVA